MAKRSHDDEVPRDFQFLQQDSGETASGDSPPDFSNVVAGNTVPYLPTRDEEGSESPELPSISVDESATAPHLPPAAEHHSPSVPNPATEPPKATPPAKSETAGPVRSAAVPNSGKASGAGSVPAKTAEADENDSDADRGFKAASQSALSATRLSRQPSAALTGYAVAVTMILLFLFLTGKVQLFGTHPLESLPDIKPLAPNEFKRVPENAELPKDHVLKLGESRRFGDVVVTPVKVTREPLNFQEFRTAAAAPNLVTEPVLCLWLKFQSVADGYAFPPFDADLMSSRFPLHSQEESTQVNSFLRVQNGGQTARVLNYLQTSDSNFVLTGQNSGALIAPGEELLTFVASEEMLPEIAASSDSEATWRVQFRKGVNVDSGNGVTTLIDVPFTMADITVVENSTIPTP